MSITEAIIKATEKKFGPIPRTRRREITNEITKLTDATKGILNDLIANDD